MSFCFLSDNERNNRKCVIFFFSFSFSGSKVFRNDSNEDMLIFVRMKIENEKRFFFSLESKISKKWNESNLLEDWGLITSLMQLFFKNKMYILVIGSAYTFRYYSHCSIALRARSKICEIIVLYLRYFLSGRFSSRDTTPPSSSSSRISPSSRLIVSFGQTRTCFHLVSVKQSLWIYLSIFEKIQRENKWMD